MGERRPHRYVIVGGPGVGKSTLAVALAQRCGLVRVDLDGIWWGPNWTSIAVNDLTERVTERIRDADSWVADGNYLDEVASVLWSAADVIVWIDLPRRVGFIRAVGRATRRVVGRQELWNGNRESSRVLTPASLLALWRRWPDYPSRIEALANSDPSYASKLVRLTSRHEIVEWTGKQPGHLSASP